MKILIKLNRFFAWLLLPFIIVFFITGYAIVGKYSLQKFMEPNLAFKIHAIIAVPTLLLFLAHSGISVFFAMKRWTRKK